MRFTIAICIVFGIEICTTYNWGNKAKISHGGPAVIRRRRATRTMPYYSHNLLLRSMSPDKVYQDFLLTEHNKYRALVPATNMRYMYWNNDLARSAQRHADRCDFRHSRDRYKTGENIWAAPYSDYTEAVRLWYEEVHLSYCQCPHAYKHCCGHYTQVVWANTYMLGCGAAQCRDIWGVLGQGHRNILVCHYSPQGNVVIANPSGTYAVRAFHFQNSTHKACSMCPSQLKHCYNGLCW